MPEAWAWAQGPGPMGIEGYWRGIRWVLAVLERYWCQWYVNGMLINGTLMAEVPEEASGEVPAEVPAEASPHFAECLCNCAGNHHLTWCPMARSAVPAEASAEVPAPAELQPNFFPFVPPPIPPWRILPLRGVPPNLPRMTGGPYNIRYDTRTGQVSEIFSHATQRYINPTTGECWTMVDGQKVFVNLG